MITILFAKRHNFFYDLNIVGRFFKAVVSVIVLFLIFFGIPVLVYSGFERFLGMIPPSELTQTAIYQLAALKGAEAFILLILYLLIIERRRGKEGRYAFFVSFLLFLHGGVIYEIWFYMTLNSPTLYTLAGICSGFVAYVLAAWFLATLYRSPKTLMGP